MYMYVYRYSSGVVMVFVCLYIHSVKNPDETELDDALQNVVRMTCL